MSVLIKGITLDDFIRYGGEYIGYLDGIGCTVELPDHGDLIDRGMALAEIEGFYPPKVRDESEAEEINRVGWECAINCIEAYLRTVKPVIPAERSEDERTCD